MSSESGTLRLMVVSNQGGGRYFDLEEGKSLLVGRGDQSDTRLDDPSMSRTHFRISSSQGEIALNDEGSSTGTFLNGNRVETALVRVGDTIRAGDTTFTVTRVQQEATTLNAPKPRLNIGNLVGKTLGGFEIVSSISKGSKSVIFKARDTKENRDAALKVMLPQFVEDEQQRERFVRAMKTMLVLKHPHIVELYAAGKSGGLCFAAMEYVEGENLAELIQRMGNDGMLDWEEVWRCAFHIARALHVGYDRRIIHRNVTPSNILRRKHDKLFKLGDFMLAKALEGALAKQITQPGQLLGDMEYLSPERTKDETEVDTRSDLYGLGATCYALLTGRPPVTGKGLIEVLQNIRNKQPEPISKYQLHIDPDFERIVMRLIEKDPNDRYATPQDLLQELEPIGKQARLETDVSDYWRG